MRHHRVYPWPLNRINLSNMPPCPPAPSQMVSGTVISRAAEAPAARSSWSLDPPLRRLGVGVNVFPQSFPVQPRGPFCTREALVSRRGWTSVQGPHSGHTATVSITATGHEGACRLHITRTPDSPGPPRPPPTRGECPAPSGRRARPATPRWAVLLLLHWIRWFPRARWVCSQTCLRQLHL